MTTSKITPSHLNRSAYLYVRQSTMRQVHEHQESTRRQYALRERAVALGWQSEQVVVIDSDLGISGASSSGREGFQRLVADVGLGRVGIVLGLEVSRLARNNADWHRLLELCGLSETLILDEDGIYDPSHYNDRLLLGLKGTMSEAELHLLRARMRGGVLAKARRGELHVSLPVGLIHDHQGRVIHHPDSRVRDALRMFFETFRRTGTAGATVKYLDDHGLSFPVCPDSGGRSTAIVWRRLTFGRAVSLLHNPSYAGAFAFGRFRHRTQPDGRMRVTKVPREDWIALIPDAHAGYITWAEFEENERRLNENACAFGLHNRRSPAREGPALLQGRVVCGRCGLRMTVRYLARGNTLVPEYRCQSERVSHRRAVCQIIPGGAIDEAVAALVLETMSPESLNVTLAVHDEIRHRLEDADRLRQQQVQAAEYSVELARRRYMEVDPTNRLVAATLEADWNETLRALELARTEAAAQRTRDEAHVGAKMRERIHALTQDLPSVWNDPRTPPKARKRMLGLIVEDVTLLRSDVITAHIRFRGGATASIARPLPLPPTEKRTAPDLVIEIDGLLDHHTDGEVVDILRSRNRRTGAGLDFDRERVKHIRGRYGLPSLHQRLLAAGKIPLPEMARQLGITYSKAKLWRRQGHIRATRSNDKDMWLCDPIADQPIATRQSQGAGVTLEKQPDSAPTGTGA